jgi:hypothetical protein
MITIEFIKLLNAAYAPVTVIVVRNGSTIRRAYNEYYKQRRFIKRLKQRK